MSGAPLTVGGAVSVSGATTLAMSDDLTMNKAAATISHTGATSLSITSVCRKGRSGERHV